MAQQRLMEITAHNMANMNTPGYKAQNLMFGAYLGKAQEDGSRVSMVQESGSYQDMSQGSLTQTSNKLDFALQGDGYFVVQTTDGIRYTRDGSFSLDSQGEIVDKSGNKVLGDNGSPLNIQPGATQITASDGGTLVSEKGNIGKLKVVTFNNPQKLTPVGDNLLYAGNAAEIPVAKVQVAQGMLENSNVQPILEMNKMIEILRMYQNTQNMLNNDDDMTKSMIQKLTSV